jgi:hypothetical protein
MNANETSVEINFLAADILLSERITSQRKIERIFHFTAIILLREFKQEEEFNEILIQNL